MCQRTSVDLRCDRDRACYPAVLILIASSRVLFAPLAISPGCGRVRTCGKPAMNKLNTAIFIFDDVEVLDFAGPFEVFSRTRLVPGVESRRSDASAPFNVFTVARSAGPVQATGGLRVLPHFDFAGAPAIDLLVIPGGFGTRQLLEDLEVRKWIQDVANSARLTTSVCTGALLLAKAGLLVGRRATTHWGAHDLLASLDST